MRHFTALDKTPPLAISSRYHRSADLQGSIAHLVGPLMEAAASVGAHDLDAGAGVARILIVRSLNHHSLRPERLIADTSCGSPEMLGRLVPRARVSNRPNVRKVALPERRLLAPSGLGRRHRNCGLDIPRTAAARLTPTLPPPPGPRPPAPRNAAARRCARHPRAAPASTSGFRSLSTTAARTPSRKSGSRVIEQETRYSRSRHSSKIEPAGVAQARAASP